ncbi:MAG: cytochrome b5 domain-containing protein [Syntrophomonadaceae bacterium]|nr:cytochrome b5 domain-containing protein [Syntrophomonadaceae bacterium]
MINAVVNFLNKETEVSTARIGLFLLFLMLCLFLFRRLLLHKLIIKSSNGKLNGLLSSASIMIGKTHIGLGVSAVLILLIHGLTISGTLDLGTGSLAWYILLFVILTATVGEFLKRIDLVRKSWLPVHKLLSFLVVVLIALHVKNPVMRYFNLDKSQGSLTVSCEPVNNQFPSINNQSAPDNTSEKSADSSKINDGNSSPTVAANKEGSSGAGSNDIRTFTLLELAKYNGQNGNPAYMAVNGTVYDLSSCKQFRSGRHKGYFAGQDLTEAYNDSIHNKKGILKELPVVGKLV